MHLRQYCSLTEEPCIIANPVVQHRPLPRKHNFDLVHCPITYFLVALVGQGTQQIKRKMICIMTSAGISRTFNGLQLG